MKCVGCERSNHRNLSEANEDQSADHWATMREFPPTQPLLKSNRSFRSDDIVVGQSKNHKRAFHSMALFPENGYAKAAQTIRGVVPMSALGQKQTSKHVQSMSALPPKADIRAGLWRS
jgi:hypothetical protein